MAIFRHGSITGGISGSLGGVTFVNGRGSPVLRHRPIRPAPKGPGIERSQALLNLLEGVWHTFTGPERAAWRTAATTYQRSNRLGQSAPLSGHQLFLKVNLEMGPLGAPFFPSPSVLGTSEGPRDFAVALSASGALKWQGQPPFGFGSAIFFVFGKVLFTSLAPKNAPPMVFLGRFAVASLDDDLRTAIEARWGPPVEDQIIICGVAASAGGLYRSPILTLIEPVGA